MGGVSFEIPGVPVAKGRARISTRGGNVRSFTPEKTVNFEARVALAAQRAMVGKELMSGAIDLTVVVHLPIPQSWSRTKQMAARLNNIRPCSRPDIDNYVKAVCDGCNAVVWKDDSQVVRLHASKVYSDRPGIAVVAMELF